MWYELSTSEIKVLRLLGRIAHPVGYFGLALRLSQHRRLLNQHLTSVLEQLVACGLVAHKPAPGYLDGIYSLTEAGQAYLAEFSEER